MQALHTEQRPCWFFPKTTGCKNGIHCRFSHEINENSAMGYLLRRLEQNQQQLFQTLEGIQLQIMAISQQQSHPLNNETAQTQPILRNLDDSKHPQSLPQNKPQYNASKPRKNRSKRHKQNHNSSRSSSDDDDSVSTSPPPYTRPKLKQKKQQKLRGHPCHETVAMDSGCAHDSKHCGCRDSQSTAVDYSVVSQGKEPQRTASTAVQTPVQSTQYPNAIAPVRSTPNPHTIAGAIIKPITSDTKKQSKDNPISKQKQKQHKNEPIRSPKHTAIEPPTKTHSTPKSTSESTAMDGNTAAVASGVSKVHCECKETQGTALSAVQSPVASQRIGPRQTQPKKNPPNYLPPRHPKHPPHDKKKQKKKKLNPYAQVFGKGDLYDTGHKDAKCKDKDTKCKDERKDIKQQIYSITAYTKSALDLIQTNMNDKLKLIIRRYAKSRSSSHYAGIDRQLHPINFAAFVIQTTAADDIDLYPERYMDICDYLDEKYPNMGYHVPPMTSDTIAQLLEEIFQVLDKNKMRYNEKLLLE
eukprot:144837_1